MQVRLQDQWIIDGQATTALRRWDVLVFV